MPVNRGQGQTTRWYQLCFAPTSPDSSDDSDIESVVLTSSTPTQTSSTWQELSPPSPLLPPPNQEPQIGWRFPPPPPPPDFLLSSMRLQHQPLQQDSVYQPSSPSWVSDGDQSDCSMHSISRVRILEKDKLFQCPICMEEFNVGGDQAYRLPCSHIYCSGCILHWLNNSKTCPVCRLQLNSCSFDSININQNNGLDSQPEILSPLVHNDLSWDRFFESPPYLIPGIENNINDNNSLDSQPEIPPSPPSDIENSVDGNSDEADYDSACDELGDSHEDGASQSAPATLT